MYLKYLCLEIERIGESICSRVVTRWAPSPVIRAQGPSLHRGYKITPGKPIHFRPFKGGHKLDDNKDRLGAHLVLFSYLPRHPVIFSADDWGVQSPPQDGI